MKDFTPLYSFIIAVVEKLSFTDIFADYFLSTDICFMRIKNTLPHLGNYEKTIFDKNKWFEKGEIILHTLRCQKAYDPKILCIKQ